MSIQAIKGIACSVVTGGTLFLYGKYVLPEEKPFTEHDQAEFRLLEKHDTEELKNWINDNEAKKLMSVEFDLNQDGQITGKEQTKAISFLSNLWKEKRNFFPATPLNIAQSRFTLLEALYSMSSDANDVHKKLTEEIDILRQK